MNDALSVHVVTGAKQLLHVDSGHIFAEDLVSHRGNFVEELATSDVLHDQVDILLVDVSLVIFDDVRVIKLCEDLDFFLDCLKVILELVFIHDLDCHLVISIMLVVGQEYLSERSRSKHLGIVIDVIVLLKLFGTLLLGRFELNVTFTLSLATFRINTVSHFCVIKVI